MNKDDNRLTGVASSQGEMNESEIDEDLMETFPASDPPSWTLGSDHHSDSKQDSEKNQSPDSDARLISDEASSRFRRQHVK
jgi:hypothetical protein